MSTSLMKYHGGKTKLAAWLIAQMPPHKCYVEPFGGGASVLLAKPSAQSEVYNDLDKDIVNVFRMVRERGTELAHKLNMTVFARDEMELAYQVAECPLERARRFLVRAEMAISRTSLHKNSGFSCTVNSKDYCSQFFTFYQKPEIILNLRDRLARVAIENTDALKLITRFDKPQTLFYLDPPYLNATRGAKSIRVGYAHNMTDAQHVELLTKCQGLKAMCMISGYENPLYNDMLKDWRRTEATAYDDAKKARKEVLWMNFEKQGQQVLVF